MLAWQTVKNWSILWSWTLLGGLKFDISTKLKPKVGPPEDPRETAFTDCYAKYVLEEVSDKHPVTEVF